MRLSVILINISVLKRPFWNLLCHSKWTIQRKVTKIIACGFFTSNRQILSKGVEVGPSHCYIMYDGDRRIRRGKFLRTE